MDRYKLTTRIDITKSNADRNANDDLKKFQQENFNSFLQGISLRANISWDDDPICKNGHWIWYFYVEMKDVYKHGNDPVALLKQDLHGIPVISNCSNTYAIFPSIINTVSDSPNTWVELV